MRRVELVGHLDKLARLSDAEKGRVLREHARKIEKCDARSRCRSRLCPVCRPAYLWFCRKHLLQALQELRRDHHPTMAAHLTLTVPSVPVERLRPAVDVVNHAFTHFLRRKPFRQHIGYLRRREERISRFDGHPLTPHLHVLLVVPTVIVSDIMDAFGPLWSECWSAKAGTGMQHDLNVHLRFLYGDEDRENTLGYLFKETRPPVDRPEQETPSIGIAELARGVDGTGEQAEDARLLAEYLLQIRGTRDFTCGGELRRYFQRLRTENT